MPFAITVTDEDDVEGKVRNYTVELDSPDVFNTTKAFVETLYATFGWGTDMESYIGKVAEALEELCEEYGGEVKKPEEITLEFVEDE